jgi:hypothetical protein
MTVFNNSGWRIRSRPWVGIDFDCHESGDTRRSRWQSTVTRTTSPWAV